MSELRQNMLADGRHEAMGRLVLDELVRSADNATDFERRHAP